MAVEVQHADGVVTVTMDHARGFNTLDSQQLQAILEAFQTLRSERSARCVVLTGASEKAFAAGADIREMVNKSEHEALVYARLGHAVANAIEGLPTPVIAAMNGYALGGGSELALACDIRLASENVQIGQPEVMLGIPPGWGGTQRLTRLVGPAVAAEVIFTGRRIGADEALRIGLVNAVYPTDRLLPEAMDLAKRIAANSPRAIAKAKQAMGLAFSGDPSSGFAGEAALFAASFGTADQREGMTAFLEKRSPVFTGDE